MTFINICTFRNKTLTFLAMNNDKMLIVRTISMSRDCNFGFFNIFFHCNCDQLVALEKVGQFLEMSTLCLMYNEIDLLM